MTDTELLDWLRSKYAQQQERVKLVALVKKRQASWFWRMKQRLKGWLMK